MITFGYKNKIAEATSITENCNSPTFGTAYLFDGDINSAFRGTATVNGTTTVLFTFGSAIFIDTIACITNLTTSGNLTLRAGATSLVTGTAFNLSLNGSGTSHLYFGNNGFQFWRIDLYDGLTAIGKHQINEAFLGKRVVISEMPSYSLENSIEEDSVELTSERGQRWVYHNYDMESWVFNFEGINSTNEGKLYNMYRYVQKNTTPFWMLLDPENNPNDIKHVRFKDNAFLSSEVTKNVFDVTLEVERKI